MIATDISAYEPTDVPQNVHFEIDDATSEWTFVEPFDFIHMRGLSGAFTDWSKVYRQAYKHLRPDGILELADWGPVRMRGQSEHSYLSIYNAACESAARKAGLGFGLEHLGRASIEAAGFKVLKERKMEVQLGTGMADARKRPLGKMALIATLEGLEAASLRLLTRELGWKANDVRDLCAKVKAELLAEGAMATFICHYVVAIKLQID